MDALKYAQELVAFESTSVLSNVAVSDYVQNELKKLAFETERLEFDDDNGVRKCSIVGKKGEGLGGIAYFGHTDVVPADNWYFDEHGPFTPTVKDHRLYGRGSRQTRRFRRGRSSRRGQHRFGKLVGREKTQDSREPHARNARAG